MPQSTRYRVRERVLVMDIVPAMQRHADYARRGYTFAVTGRVATDRVLSLARKFDSLYGTNQLRHARGRLRARGVASAVLLVYRLPFDPHAAVEDQNHAQLPVPVGFTLMVTDGDNAAHHLEQLRQIADDQYRVTIGDHELVRRTRPGHARPSWSWQIRKAVYREWRERLLRSARGDDGIPPSMLLAELYATPGFAAARSQVGRLASWYRRCWRRYRSSSTPFPRLPRLYYVRRLSNEGVWLP